MIKTNLTNNNDYTTKDSRSVSRILNSLKTMEGEGFLVHRSFPTHFLPDVDPFMLLDEMGEAFVLRYFMHLHILYKPIVYQ